MDTGTLKEQMTRYEKSIILHAIEQEGSITVPAKMFTDLVSKMPADTVNMVLNEMNQTLTASTGSSALASVFSVMSPCSANQRSASMDAVQPVPAAVMACW